MHEKRMGIIAKYKTAPCQGACPAGVDVPRYIRFIRAGQFDLALAVIRERIPFPAVCGYACVHPCETMCARHQYDEPVAIRLLKRAAVEKGNFQVPLPTAAPTGKHVAVIGAGPGGLTAAYYLAGQGHQVTVLEARPQAGGMMRYSIPEYRLPNDVIDREIAVITDRNVVIKTNTRVASASELLASGYDAVLAATGAWVGSKTGAPTDAAAPIIDGVTFLEQVNTGQEQSIGQQVVVIGGGNTAIDAARAARRLGAAEVTVFYRRTRAEMPASPDEIQDALEEGVQIEFLVAPVQINPDSLVSTRMRLGEKDQSGRPRPVPISGSEFTTTFDLLIEAVGQSADASVLNLGVNANGTARVDHQTLATDQPGIFGGGDLVTGPASIIEAIAQGRLAAASIDRFLGGTGVIDEKLAEGIEAAAEEPAILGSERTRTYTISLTERLQGFGQVELGYDEILARNEAGRCLGCDIRDFSVEVDAARCKECGYCKEVCSLGIYEPTDTFNAQGYQPMQAVNTDKCVGCLRCFMICPDFAITIAGN
ncbi:MAG: FAD-dependent oxidoreductase [Syntrophomonadaceae bacterium]|nr:FAD-dependent oxidoreductase [Syntrophomonadaceae bacterium]